MASYLKWPSLYNDQLFTMATSLYNGYYSTKANCLYNGHLSTTATSLQWPNFYNGFVSNNGHLSTMASSLYSLTSLQWPPLSAMDTILYKSQLSVQWPSIYYSHLSTMAKSL